MAASTILGLNTTGYNTSAVLLVDGAPVYAVQEERLNRDKLTRRFPMQSIRAALDFAGIGFDDVDEVAIGWNPAVNLEAFNGPNSERHRHFGEILFSVPNHLMTLKGDDAGPVMSQELRFLDGSRVPIHYVNHHLTHAAAFFCSPFDDAAIMAIDAWGEKLCVLMAHGQGNRIETKWQQEYPHSLGSFYATFTEYLGFKPDSDEWKVMGASAYGDPSRFGPKLRQLVQLVDGDGFRLDLSYFNHFQFHRPHLYGPKMVDLLGFGPNPSGDDLSEEHYDLAAAVQAVTEDVYMHLLNDLHRRTGVERLVLAGGVACNTLANGRLFERTPFEATFLPPLPDDSGCSLGAALYVHHAMNGAPRGYVMHDNYLGPGFTDEEIREQLALWSIPHRVVEDPSREAAALVAAGKIIGWFQGRLEFGDRALGNRSIVADPRDASMKDRVNAMVKYREPFRPFAPSILIEHLDEFFVGAKPTPFMEHVFPVREDKRAVIPAVTHEDGTGRLQTVRREVNPKYYALIDAFRDLTGVPVVLNTSFNLKGEPVVGSPHDALRTFNSSGLHALVIGNCVVEK